MLQKLLRNKGLCIRQLCILILLLTLAGLFPTSASACAHFGTSEQSSSTDYMFLYSNTKIPEYSCTTSKALISTPEALAAIPEVLITTPEFPVTLSVGKQQSLHTGRFFSHFQNTLRKVRTPFRLLSQPLLSQLFSIFVSLCFLLFSVFMLQVKQRLSIILYIHRQDGQKGLSILSLSQN